MCRVNLNRADGILRIFLSFFLLSVLSLSSGVHPAWADFTCNLDQVDSSALGTKTPLILVHGIHGWNSDYWQNFTNYFNSKQELTSRYKLYRFDYDSDVVPVATIGQHFANKVNAFDVFNQNSLGEPSKRSFVIVAHSMGGLVSREYMQNCGGAERIIKLITLATPHHGSPGANDEDALEDYYTNGTWDQIFSVSQLFYNLTSAADGAKWDVTMHSSQPNRSDLRWDSDQLHVEQNESLVALNFFLTLDQEQKIIAYYGYIDPDREDRLFWEVPGNIIFWLPWIITDAGPHTKLIIASAVMDAGLSEIFPLNDGMVPTQSGSFEGRSLDMKRPFFDHDHLDMKDGKPGSVLFDTLKTDLVNIHPGIKYTPAAPHVLQEIEFDGARAMAVATGSSVSLDWNFGDGDTGTGLQPTHTYRSNGTYTVTLIVSDETGNDYDSFTLNSRAIVTRKEV
jgi:pimeloyl-ACP methyl ester carboxylesterase